ILTSANGLKMVDALTSSDARQNFTLFGLAVLRDHKCNGLADRLAGRVAEDVLSRFVPACNNAIEILAHNRVVARLYYGGQPAQPLLTFAERPFDLYACSNIAIGFQHSVVTKHLHAALDDDLATILADVAQLAQPGLPALELRAQLSKIDRKFCLQERVAAASDCFAQRKTVKPLGPGVPKFDRPAQSPRDHRFVGQCQQI